MTSSTTEVLQEYYEGKLRENGVNFSGIAWPSANSTILRYHIMSDLFERDRLSGSPISILDIGCGPGFYLDYLKSASDLSIDYHGIDISPDMIKAAQSRHPNESFEVRDVLTDPLEPNSADYAVINGVLTVKSDISNEKMTAFSCDLLRKTFAAVRKGLAVNFMSEHVDRKRDDLFHYPLDSAAEFFKADLTRHFVFRADYGLWEYTAYLYLSPQEPEIGPQHHALTELLNGIED